MMSVPFFLAKKYFLSRKKETFIQVISWLSVGAMAVGTMALIIGLSAFNGLERLLKESYDTFTPDIKMIPAEGKTWQLPEEDMAHMTSLFGVRHVGPVIEDYALARYENRQRLVRIKGVEPQRLRDEPLRQKIIRGSCSIGTNTHPMVLISASTYHSLAISLHHDWHSMTLLYPSAKLSYHPENMYQQINLSVSGVFSIPPAEEEDYVLLPLHTAAQLTGFGGRRTAWEITVTDKANPKEVIRNIKQKLKDKVLLLSKRDQHQDIYQLLATEKIFVFAVLGFILLVASFNIFFSLAMMSIDKRHDLSVLRSMGFSKGQIGRTFLYLGGMIGGWGGLIGLSLGIGLVLSQAQHGWFSMGLTMDAQQPYPVWLKGRDVLWIGVGLTLITTLSAWYPAQTAKRKRKTEHGPAPDPII